VGEARPVYVRLPREIHELLKDVAEKRGESVSDFIRRATLKELVRLGYLPEDYAKALGIRAQPHELACDGGEPDLHVRVRCYRCEHEFTTSLEKLPPYSWHGYKTRCPKCGRVIYADWDENGHYWMSEQASIRPLSPELGRYPWCGAPLPGWEPCPAREACLKGELDYCEYPEREYEYYGERSLEPEWLCDGGEPEGSDGGQRCYTCSTSSPAEGLRRALRALKESFEKASLKVEIFEDAIEALAGEPQPEVSQAELVRLAAERYPGYPLPLAMAKVLNDLWVLGGVRPVRGLMWGGVHEENIPDIVAKLVRSMYEGSEAPIRAITVRIEVEDPLCEDYTHFWVEVVDVERPDGR